MRLATPYFAFDLPAGFVERPAETCAAFVREADRMEITVSTLVSDERRARAAAPLDDTLRRFSQHQQEALSAAAGDLPKCSLIHLETLAAFRVASFFAVAKSPMLAFCASLTTLEAERGRRCLVAFSVYQYYVRGDSPPTVEGFRAFARGVLHTVEPRLPSEDSPASIHEARIAPVIDLATRRK